MEAGPVPGLNKSTTTPAVTKFVEVQHHPEKALKRTAAGFIRSPTGRDSLLRTVQYTLRLLLLYRLRSNPPKPSFKPSKTIQTSFAIVSLLSALRRILALQAVLKSLQYLMRTTRGNPLSLITTTSPRKSSKIPQNSIETLLQLSRNTLDLVAVITDNLYLGSQLRIIPSRYIDKSRASKIDRISDLSTLGSVLLGFWQVERKRKTLKLRGNDKREKVVEMEKDLEESEFWRDGGKEGEVRTKEKVEEERRLREKVRSERGKLRRMREELKGLKWDKLKLSAEGIFAIYDALDLQIGRELAKSWSGAMASLIEASQAWSEYLRA
ncbi:hypothetical protein JCM3765_000589 [Sporobolomyces pararoseus]